MVLMPFSPRRARPPSAHSFARRARPELQPPPAAGLLRPGRGVRRVRSRAGGRPGEADARGGMAMGQSQSRLPLLGGRAPGGCLRAALVGPAYLHPPPGPSGLESPTGDARPRPGPAPRSRGPGLRSELRSGARFKVCSASPWEGAAGREESLEFALESSAA